MKTTFSFSALATLWLSLVPISLTANESPVARAIPEIPSPAEAATLVAAEMAAREARQQATTAAVWNAPASAEWEIRHADRSTILRRVAAPPVPPASPIATVNTASMPADPPDWSEHATPFHSINLSARVFDHAVSQVTWRDADGDQWQILSNINFNHLSQVTRIEGEEGRWLIFPFIENIDTAREQEFATRAAEAGKEYHPRIPPTDIEFPAEVPEYVVFAESENDVPEALVLELDMIHAYYAKNHEILAAQYERNRAINEARRAWHEANPPVPRDTILNFWVRP